PIAGLGVVYLLGVLAIAIRRGQLAALGTAALSVLALNYFFIAPRHQLTISNSENVATLVVFGIVAVVVGRLASQARARLTQAEDRAREAQMREREAEMVAAAASAVLEGAGPEAQLASIARGVGRAAGGHGQDRGPARDLPRPALAADRDHHRGGRAGPRRPGTRGPRRAHRRARHRDRPAGAPGRRPARRLAHPGRRRQPALGLVRP